jgi:PAS domain S-box-containing protein
LQQLACLGNIAEITTLSIVLGTSEDQIHAALWPAVRQELVQHLAGAYRFVHDRVQEAAYSLIPEELRGETHLRIGRVLAAHTPLEKREEAIFDVVNQLNRGAALITSRDERDRVAQLNLIAGRRARASAAYASALKYFVAGAVLLRDDCWERQHDLAFSLELHRAECDFLTGDPALAEERLTALSSRAASTVEKATVAGLRMDVFTTLGQLSQAVAICLDYLRGVGVEWSPHPGEEEARRAYDAIWVQLGERPIEEMVDLPLVSDPASLATLEVLNKVAPAALFTNVNLFALASCKGVSLSLERGNSDASCALYVWLGMVAGACFGNYKAGYRFGQVGYELVERRGLRRFLARTYSSFGNQVTPWTKHIRAGRDLVRRAFEAANNLGDLTYGAYSSFSLITNLLAAGDSLIGVQREAEHRLAFVQKARFSLVVDIIATQLGLVRTLRGLTQKFGSFDDEQFDELLIERRFADNPNLARAECWYWVRKLQARFLAGDYASAIEVSSRAQRLLWTSISQFETAEYHFYGALSRAAGYDHATADQRQAHMDALAAHYRQLQIWAENCPENFETRAALVGAEIARIGGREPDAMRLYEQAIRSARANGFIHNEALANELAARFYAARDFEQIAQLYLRNARYCYLRWGANGKVRQLDELYPYLREKEAVSGATSTIKAPVEHLDLATVLKVSQAVSGEIVLEKLIEMLMTTALEHGGAERGLLILVQGDNLRIEAEATTGHSRVEVTVREVVVTPYDLPESILHHVIRTRESVVLDDALVSNLYSDDEYVRQKRPRSVLCLPIVKRAKLVGALYLENTLTPHAFTSGRIAVLELLASQAAISLENATLYSDLRRSEAYLAEAQRLSQTGSFGRNVSSGEIFWSDETFRIFGYDKAASVTLDMALQRVHPDDLALVQRTIERASQDRKDYADEYRLLMPDGSVKHVRVVAHAVMDKSGRTEFVGAVMDVTAAKLAEEEQQEAQTKLERAARLTTLGELTASIAHEVNQPLAGLVNDGHACLNWLNSQPANIEEARESVDCIIKSGRRAAEVIKRIRALTQKTAVQKAPLDINDVIEDVMPLVRHEVLAHSVSLRLELAAALPPVLGDRVQLQQVIVNILMNAIQAMKSVTERPRELLIRSREHGPDQILVAVEDSGTGIEPQNVDRLFGAFFTTKPDGMGIGLSICRSIINQHGGRIWATRNSEGGSTFQFTLDTRREMASQAVAEADFVQENGPERPDFKSKLFAEMNDIAPPDSILACSSSGLTMDVLQSDCKRPQRCVIGHPFNPPHIIPLVEVVVGAKTAPETIDRAMAFHASVGKKPIRLFKALPRHVANRLQAALYKEILYLVQEGVLSVADTAVCGPELRWGVMGPGLQWHVGGGPGGIRHFMDHLMDPLFGMMKTLGNPQLNSSKPS